ncbi:hypothetical protein BGM24_24830 [Bacillus sp. FJAT-26377]|nr:hypothetical protein [Bacillus sp. FJAT-26377]
MMKEFSHFINSSDLLDKQMIANNKEALTTIDQIIELFKSTFEDKDIETKLENLRKNLCPLYMTREEKEVFYIEEMGDHLYSSDGATTHTFEFPYIEEKSDQENKVYLWRKRNQVKSNHKVEERKKDLHYELEEFWIHNDKYESTINQ